MVELKDRIFERFARAAHQARLAAMAELQAVDDEVDDSVFASFGERVGDVTQHPFISSGDRLQAEPGGELFRTNGPLFELAADRFRVDVAEMSRAMVRGSGDPQPLRALSTFNGMCQAAVDLDSYRQVLASASSPESARAQHLYHRLRRVIDHDGPSFARDVVESIEADVRGYLA